MSLKSLNMNMFNYNFYLYGLLITLSFTLSGCATQSQKRLTTTVSAFTLGAAIGAGTSPKDERVELHAMYWGGLLGLTAAVVSNYLYNDEKELAAARLETEKLKAELELIQNAKKTLLKEGSGRFKTAEGEEYFQSGRAKWRIYQIDQWVKDGPSKIYHQDKMLELVPINE